MAVENLFNFSLLNGNDPASYNGINQLINSIADKLSHASTGLSAAAKDDPITSGYTLVYTGSTFAAAQVDTPGIADGAIIEDKIETSAVTQSKIAAGAVSVDKLPTTLDLTGKTVTVATPSTTANPTTKDYVDSAIAGVTSGNQTFAGAVTATSYTANTNINATGNITGAAISGPLTGNVTGNVSGSAASATNATTATNTALLRATPNSGNVYLTASTNALTATGALSANINGSAASATNAGTASGLNAGTYGISINGSAASATNAGTANSQSGGNVNATVLASAHTSINKVTGNPANLRIQTGSPYEFERSTSSRRFKTNIRDYAFDPNKLMAFRGVVFNSICENDDQDKDIVGFIAEEAIEAGLGDFVDYNDDTGEVEGFHYANFTAALLEFCKYQQSLIDNLEARVAVLEGN